MYINFFYKDRRYKQIVFSKLYATNLKTTISQRKLKNFARFATIIIDNIINMSVLHDQNYHQWQCSIIVM